MTAARTVRAARTVVTAAAVLGAPFLLTLLTATPAHGAQHHTSARLGRPVSGVTLRSPRDADDQGAPLALAASTGVAVGAAALMTNARRRLVFGDHRP